MRMISVLLILTICCLIFPVKSHANPIPAEREFPKFLWIPIAIGGAVVTTGLLYRYIGQENQLDVVSFKSEDIMIHLESGGAMIEGLYTFENTGEESRKQVLVYPFKVNDDIGFPVNLSVLCNGKELEYRWKGEKEIEFEVGIPANSTIEVEVTCYPPCMGNDYTYILETTKSWGEPIERARFTIYAYDGIYNLSTPYPFIESVSTDGCRLYTYEAYNFMPDRDLEIEWQ